MWFRPRRPPLPSVGLPALALLLLLPLAGGVREAPARVPASGLASLQLQGAELASQLGCGACHAGMPDPDLARMRAPALGSAEAPVTARFVFEYLADPQPRREGIVPTRMPDFRLSEGERLALALALGSEPRGVSDVRGRHPEVEPGDGRLLFEALGCRGCHGEPGTGWGEGPLAGADAGAADPVAPDLSAAGARYREEWLASFLAAPVRVRPAGHHPGSGSRMPDFRLTPGEVEALTAWLGTLGSPAEAPVLPELTPWGRARAEAYLTDRLSCLGCHSWRGDGGRIAPPLDGLPRRLHPAEIPAMIHDPAGTRPGSVMPPSPFQDRILDRVVALLATDTAQWAGTDGVEVPWDERRGFLEEGAATTVTVATGDAAGGPASATAGAPAPDAARGRVLYQARCAQCHGTRGNGGGFNAPWLPVAPTAHNDAAAMSRRPDDTLYDGIAAGAWVLDGSHRMPAFGGALEREEIRALVAYIRELCDCVPPGWSRGGGG